MIKTQFQTPFLQLKRSANSVLGTVVSPPDNTRGTPGLLEVSSQLDGFFGFQVGQIVPFMGDDYRGMYNPNLPHGGPINQPPSRIAKGDQMHFTVSIIPGTTYCRATHVRTVRTKRDSLLSEQVPHFARSPSSGSLLCLSFFQREILVLQVDFFPSYYTSLGNAFPVNRRGA